MGQPATQRLERGSVSMYAEKLRFPPQACRGLRKSTATAAILVFLVSVFVGDGATRQSPASTAQGRVADNGYVGSKVCSRCHLPIYKTYSQTDMGRSMSSVTPALLAKIPNLATVHDPRSKRQFDVVVRDGALFQSEYEIGGDGKEIFRDTHRIDWIIGSGANGFGAIVQRDNHLFEAPLSFYSKTHSWALSPGYEFYDYGFSRPILRGCIVCHSGQPQAVPDGNGLYREPAFTELAIGCENCHGPGAAHVKEMMEGGGSEESNHSITNPVKLSPWLASNICMSCHQIGDARVLQPGKDYRDFRPGEPLDATLTILMVPPDRKSPPQTDLLEHYFSMVLSKCYRSSGGRLSCITCHDPHVQPAQQETPAFFRQKCLTCHTEKSCAVLLAIRQRKTPPDDCAGCHMPKRDVKVISHAVLTNHRIIAESEEPYPEAAFQMTTPALSDLVHLNAIPGKQDSKLSPLILLQAYAQLMASHVEFRGRYLALAAQLETTNPENISVLEALADGALQQKSARGTAAAIQYLDRAIKQGAVNPVDFEQLASLLIQTGRLSDAVEIAERGIRLISYDAELYRLLGRSYLLLKKPAQARAAVMKGLEIFPGDSMLRQLAQECEAARNASESVGK
jgi:hypothetical protein